MHINTLIYSRFNFTPVKMYSVLLTKQGKMGYHQCSVYGFYTFPNSVHLYHKFMYISD